VYKIAHSARRFGRKLDCHARHSSQWECRLIKELGHVSTLSFSYRRRVGGEPDLRCGAFAITAPTPNPALKTQASSEPSTAAKVENWTKKQWNAAKQKWSQDKAKWNACNQDTKDQKLSGRKSWSYLYDCMTKA
jgi:hypothetical protein